MTSKSICRYIIVVDDIREVETWDVIKYIFPKNSRHSIIITTTRMRDVADSCCSSFNGHVYDIKPLDMVKSKQLFHRRLFNLEEHCPLFLEDTSNQILKKCDGLPLALIVISGLLASKERTVDIWNQVKDSIGRTLERSQSAERMMKILSFSYLDLPSHLKSCLLSLGIFPEGTIIQKECLIMRWVAEGFIYREGTYTVYELGEMCFNDLVNRSLIQLVNEKYHKPNSCRVHVAIHDFIISKSIEENFVTLVGVPFVPINANRKVRRLSLQVAERGTSVLPTRDLMLSHARSLNVFGKTGEIPPLDKFRYLRIMNLGSSSSLSYGNYKLENHHIKNIERLLHLRYLNLSGSGITELPQHIGCLQCLETVDLRGTTIRVLPASIVNLGKLVHLLTNENVMFPEGIVKLQSLEVLQQVSVFKQTFNFIQELGQLMNLRMMCIDFEEHKLMNYGWGMCSRIYFEEDIPDEDTRDATEWEEPVASCFRDLVSLNNLHSLEIRGGSRFLPLGTLCPVPLSLRKLILFLHDQPFPKVPEWMPSLANLQELHIDVKGITHNDLCILGSLPALLKLELAVRYCNSEDTILTINGDVGFPCLTKFQYSTWSRGMDLKFAAGSMPKLATLMFSTGSPYIRDSDTFGFDFGIINLPSLITLECIVSGVYKWFEAATMSAANAHPNSPIVLFGEHYL
jgi:disease resistance protein RPM1